MCYTSSANPNFLDGFEIDIANILSTSSLLLHKQLICLHIPMLNSSLMFWLDSSVLQSLHIINTATRISVNTSAWGGLSFRSLQFGRSTFWRTRATRLGMYTWQHNHNHVVKRNVEHAVITSKWHIYQAVSHRTRVTVIHVNPTSLQKAQVHSFSCFGSKDYYNSNH